MDDRLSPLAARLVAGGIFTIAALILLDLTGIADLPRPAVFVLFVLNAMLAVRWMAHRSDVRRSTGDA